MTQEAVESCSKCNGTGWLLRPGPPSDSVVACPECRTSLRLERLLTIAYDDEKCDLYIRFRSSVIYRYADVPPEEWLALKNSPSKGQFFMARIKGRFTHTRMWERGSKK